jgi:dTDP-4-dehydrorhamnose 3,5-epimerase
MVVTKTNIEGLLTLEPRVFEDARGVFYETFNRDIFREKTGLDLQFLQDNESISCKNVVRGLHFQIPPFAQGKLVRVVSGKVLDVAVDLRKASATYGKHQVFELSAENKKQLWIPPGFAHGFVALEDNSVFNYKCTNYYSPVSERTIQWNDVDLNIDWQIVHPIVSEKDQNGINFATFVSQFD